MIALHLAPSGLIPDPIICRARSNLIAVAIGCWQLQFFEIAELIVNWVAIAIAIASTLTALNWLEDCYKSVEASTFKKYNLYETCSLADSIYKISVVIRKGLLAPLGE